MITHNLAWTKAFGATKRATKRSPRLQGEAFVRALELTSAFLQGNDAAVARMVCETHDEDCCEIMYTLLALTYAIDEAGREGAETPNRGYY